MACSGAFPRNAGGTSARGTGWPGLEVHPASPSESTRARTIHLTGLCSPLTFRSSPCTVRQAWRSRRRVASGFMPPAKRTARRPKPPSASPTSRDTEVGYALLTGTHLFEGRSVVESCAHHLHTPPTPPEVRAGRALPGDLCDAILRCLEKKPEARYESARALVGGAWRAGGVGSDRAAPLDAHRHPDAGARARQARGLRPWTTTLTPRPLPGGEGACATRSSARASASADDAG